MSKKSDIISEKELHKSINERLRKCWRVGVSAEQSAKVNERLCKCGKIGVTAEQAAKGLGLLTLKGRLELAGKTVKKWVKK